LLWITWAIRYERDRIKVYSLGPSIGENFGQKEKGIVPDQVQYDFSPQWFSGGTFEFSQNNEVLVHRTRWGNTVRIHLADGTILQE